MQSIKQFEDYFDSTVIPGSYIGVHGISKSDDVFFTGKSILNYGLNMRYQGGLNSCCTMFGTLKTEVLSKICSYKYTKDKNNMVGNVVVAIPELLEDIEGNEWYIGPFEDLYLGNYEDRIERVLQHPFNAYVNFRGMLPKEFIVGFFVKDVSNDSFVDFVTNPHYIGLMSDDEKRIYFESLKTALVGYGLKKVNDPLNKILCYGSTLFYNKSFLKYILALEKSQTEKNK